MSEENKYNNSAEEQEQPAVTSTNDSYMTDGDNPHSLCANCRENKKLMVYDWLGDTPENVGECDYVEVQFKNTRKGYYLNDQKLDLHKGDMVAVEGTPGHDIGEVTLTGYLVHMQMKKTNYHFDDPEVTKKVFRLARPADMEKYYEAKDREHETMLRSRQIAEGLGLEMKIGDVEFQGDGQKAIFYYIADGRVDFRQLIKDLAAAFHVRIEMKQIGARQEAGRIGGIGPCGRELCCAKWLTKFNSVGTAAARFQDLSLNPQKLAGQCAKLKCCLNFEVDHYMEASKDLPNKDIILQTQDNDYFLFKQDILARTVTYSTSKDGPFNLVTISASRAFEVYGMNKRGLKPEKLNLSEGEEERPEFSDGVGDEDLTRFDRRKKHKKRNKSKDHGERQEQNAADNTPIEQQPAHKQERKPVRNQEQEVAHGPEENAPQESQSGEQHARGQKPRHNHKPHRRHNDQNQRNNQKSEQPKNQ